MEITKYEATPHIKSINSNEIAKTVLMPGDPLRAKWIAETYLTDVIQINDIRNVLGYTGKYKGKPITVFASGMGMPSIGIYSYELYSKFGVENIIRVGSCGAYTPDLKLYDTLLASKAYSLSSYAKVMGVSSSKLLKASSSLNNKIIKSAAKLGLPLITGVIHSSDNFYYSPNTKFDYNELLNSVGAIAVEMESFALFANAISLHKNAACLLTVSDNLATKEFTTSEERQTAFKNMIEIALNI